MIYGGCGGGVFSSKEIFLRESLFTGLLINILQAFTGSLLSASFTAPAGLDDILRYSAEVSTNMLPGTQSIRLSRLTWSLITGRGRLVR